MWHGTCAPSLPSLWQVLPSFFDWRLRRKVEWGSPSSTAWAGSWSAVCEIHHLSSSLHPTNLGSGCYLIILFWVSMSLFGSEGKHFILFISNTYSLSVNSGLRMYGPFSYWQSYQLPWALFNNITFCHFSKNNFPILL